ncbi:hypothetical protein [Streptomyces alfalfae]|uniref:hypothetical protein n=1 Tax=Streptomyces alfalfae TaxID=1642299 RepID=UPI00300256CC
MLFEVDAEVSREQEGCPAPTLPYPVPLARDHVGAAPHLRTAMAVMRGYVDADGGVGVGPTDAMNVALAAAFRTADIFTPDGHFRMMRPLAGQPAFRLLPDDL